MSTLNEIPEKEEVQLRFLGHASPGRDTFYQPFIKKS